MRLRTPLVVAVVAAVAVVSATIAPASAQDPGCAGASAVFGCNGGNGGGESPSVDGGTGGAGGTGESAPVDYDIFVAEDGTPVNPAPGYEDQGCWAIQAVPEGEGVSYEEALADQQKQGGNGVLWGACEAGDTIDPTFLAGMYWEREAAPPPPTPLYVAPGKAVTGLAAFLEIGGEVPTIQSFGTPIGTLTFTMTPRYAVAWGDGASSDTTSQGGPYPNGDLSHTYIEEGGVTITVAAYWHATWTLAGAGGDLPELPVPTEGALDLPVEQRQVVIDPG